MSQTATLSDFNKAFDRVIQHEGGYVNDPRDAGGETKFGITIHTARANGYTGSMFTMTRDDAKQIYLKAFWHAIVAMNFPLSLPFSFLMPVSITVRVMPAVCYNVLWVSLMMALLVRLPLRQFVSVPP